MAEGPEQKAYPHDTEADRRRALCLVAGLAATHAPRSALH